MHILSVAWRINYWAIMTILLNKINTQYFQVEQSIVYETLDQFKNGFNYYGNEDDNIPSLHLCTIMTCHYKLRSYTLWIIVTLFLKCCCSDIFLTLMHAFLTFPTAYWMLWFWLIIFFDLQLLPILHDWCHTQKAVSLASSTCSLF